MGLFGNSKELQFGTCGLMVNQPLASPESKGETPSFIEEGDFRGAVVNKVSIEGDWEFEV